MTWINSLFRDIGLGVNLSTRIAMMFDIQGIGKRRWVQQLVMLINPKTFERSSSKIITTQKTRGGWVMYHWGDDLDTLTAAGATASFILPYGGLASGSSKPLINRTVTVGYMNFLSLMELYRSNGLLWNENGVPVRAGTIRLFYDCTYYNGYFESFNFQESDKIPYRFNVDFSFKVQKTFATLSPGSPY